MGRVATNQIECRDAAWYDMHGRAWTKIIAGDAGDSGDSKPGQGVQGAHHLD